MPPYPKVSLKRYPPPGMVETLCLGSRIGKFLEFLSSRSRLSITRDCIQGTLKMADGRKGMKSGRRKAD